MAGSARLIKSFWQIVLEEHYMQHENKATGAGTVNVRTIAVTGGKGGVGKTCLAVNVATALAQSGQNVLLLDGDLGLSSVDVMLGLTPRHTLEQMLSGERQLQDIILKSPDGVQVVPAASGVARMAALSAKEHAAIVNAFATLPSPVDVLVIDTAPGIGESVLRFCAASQQLLVVVCDEPTSLTDAYALIKVLNRNHQIKRFHVLANRIPHGSGEALFKRLQRVTDRYLDVNLQYAGAIPEDDTLGKSVRAQRALLDAFPGSAAARAIKQLAANFLKWPRSETPSGGLEFFFERLFATAQPGLTVIK
jgi:flagellar biosynthesis protein FlhG